MNTQARLHCDLALVRGAGLRSYEIAAESERQRKEEQQAAYEQALDREIERIWTQPDEVQEALGYTTDQAGLEHAMVMSVIGSVGERERWSKALKQHIYDAVCNLARVNLQQK